MVSCTWVKDDLDDCPYGFWLKLRYTYNILDVEAAPKYVTDAYVYIYDSDGKYVKRIYVNRGDLVTNDYRVRIEDLPEGDYQFVVWSGMGNSQYAVSGDTKTISDFRLSLVGAGGNYAGELPALYHGYLQSVHFDDSYAQYDVELMKNTNQLACLVVTVSDEIIMNPDDYTLEVTADNVTMDAYNHVVPAATTTYEPFVKEGVIIDDSDYGKLPGIKFNIMTLRLMSDKDCRLILRNKQSGQSLFNISFAEYIGMIGTFYTNLGREIPVQEYLDRQDFYTIVFYLSAELDRLIQLQVNSWRLRVNNHLKL
jgi:hypothetical protein